MRRGPLLVALLGLGCASPAPRTQVMLEIDAEPAVRRASAQLSVEIRGGERDRPAETYPVRYARDFDGEALRWPRRVALAPLDPEPPRGWVATIAARALDGALVARTTLRGGYVEGRAVRVVVLLEERCVAVECEGQRCLDGGCVDPAIDVSTAPDLEE